MSRDSQTAVTDVAAVRALVDGSPWAMIVSALPGRAPVASQCPVILDDTAPGEDLVLLSHVGRPDERMHELGARVVDRFERLLPEPVTMRRTLENAEYAERIVGGTVGFRLRVKRFDAKDEMSQDMPAAAVRGVADPLRSPGPYRNPALAGRIAAANHLSADAAATAQGVHR